MLQQAPAWPQPCQPSRRPPLAASTPSSSRFCPRWPQLQPSQLPHEQPRPGRFHPQPDPTSRTRAGAGMQGRGQSVPGRMEEMTTCGSCRNHQLQVHFYNQESQDVLGEAGTGSSPVRGDAGHPQGGRREGKKGHPCWETRERSRAQVQGDGQTGSTTTSAPAEPHHRSLPSASQPGTPAARRALRVPRGQRPRAGRGSPAEPSSSPQPAQATARARAALPAAGRSHEL